MEASGRERLLVNGKKGGARGWERGLPHSSLSRRSRLGEVGDGEMGKLVVVGEVLEAVEGLRESNYVGRWLALADGKGGGEEDVPAIVAVVV